MSVRYLRAEELARLAGVAKSTVLAAIRRGEITSSRTVGRGTRIAIESARTYLQSRGCPIPDELREPRETTVAVVTEREDVVALVRAVARASWTVVGGTEAYATLLWIGVNAPAMVVVDLDMSLLHPFEVLRALREHAGLAGARVVAVGSQGELVAAARVVGAMAAASLDDRLGIARILGRELPRDLGA
jgi:excisionase family DNA binding protein